jgi:hypothetical protein
MKSALIIFLSFILICQISCSASPFIKGQVFDRQNNPLPDVDVRFIAYKVGKDGPLGGVKSASKTNEKGEYEVRLEKAQIDERIGLVVVKEGYKTETIKLTEKEMQKYEEVFRDYRIHLDKNE